MTHIQNRVERSSLKMTSYGPSNISVCMLGTHHLVYNDIPSNKFFRDEFLPVEPVEIPQSTLLKYTRRAFCHILTHHPLLFNRSQNLPLPKLPTPPTITQTHTPSNHQRTKSMKTSISIAVSLLLAAVSYAAVVDVPSPSPEIPDPFSDECQRAFKSCNFRFAGLPDSVPTFDISGPSDVSFTPPLVWADRSRRVGVANANQDGEIIENSSVVLPFSQWDTGFQRLSRTQFKTYPIPKSPFSGIGHEVFQGNEAYAKGKCVRVYITSYQTLNGSNPPLVTGNVNNAHECVVFKTRD